MPAHFTTPGHFRDREDLKKMEDPYDEVTRMMNAKVRAGRDGWAGGRCRVPAAAVINGKDGRKLASSAWSFAPPAGQGVIGFRVDHSL